jgi:flagellar hook-associated protein 2
LIIRGTETGSDYDVITNLDASSSFAVTNVNAADAEFTLDGINYTRSSNSINDVIDGVTFQLMSDDDSVSGTTISVMQGTDNSQTIIEDLITAYNDLIDTYKTLTANSYNSDSGETGTFANNPTMLYFVNEIKSRFAAGIVYGTDATDTISLGEMGIYLSEDGVASFDSADFESAQADGLQSKLAEGAYMGYNDSDDYLNYYITELIGSTGSGGIFADIVVNEQEAVDDLYDKEDTLQDRLTSIQNNYITQYSALNALLYQLSVTSNSLTSALDALSNNNNN